MTNHVNGEQSEKSNRKKICCDAPTSPSIQRLIYTAERPRQIHTCIQLTLDPTIFRSSKPSKPKSRSKPTSKSSLKLSRPKSFICNFSNCARAYRYKGDLQRHQRTHSQALMRAFQCPFAPCTAVGIKGFARKDHLMQHLRTVHRN